MIAQELDVARHQIHVEPQFWVACQLGQHIDHMISSAVSRRASGNRWAEPIRRTQTGIQQQNVAGMLVGFLGEGVEPENSSENHRPYRGGTEGSNPSPSSGES